jgi:iron complex transport system substrate-binding protein
MKLPARCLVLLSLLAGACARRPGPSASIRVVSQTVGSDELLLALAQPKQIAALSHLALESAYSAVADEAKAYPHLVRDGDVEGILKYRPTLVLFANYSRAELIAQVERAGIKTLTFSSYETLGDAYANLRRLAAELGPEAKARAESIVANCQARVEDLRLRLAGRPRVRVIAPSTYGLIPGTDSTFQDLCDHAGADNLAASLGHLHGHAPPPEEQMLTWPIDVVVLAGTNRDQALARFRALPPYQYMPAVQRGRLALLAPYQLSCVSHHRVEAYETLARALHPEAFP